MTEALTAQEGYDRPFDQVVRDSQFTDLAALVLSGIRDAKTICAMLNITRRRMDLLVSDPGFDLVYNTMHENYADDWKKTIADVSIDPMARSQMIHVKGQELLATTIERLAKRIEDDTSADPKMDFTSAPELRAAIAAAKVAMEGAHVARGVGETNVGVQVNVPVFVPSAEQVQVLADTTREMDAMDVDDEPGTVRVLKPVDSKS